MAFRKRIGLLPSFRISSPDPCNSRGLKTLAPIYSLGQPTHNYSLSLSLSLAAASLLVGSIRESNRFAIMLVYQDILTGNCLSKLVFDSQISSSLVISGSIKFGFD